MSDPAAALIVMVGPPGSGKSTWVGSRFRTEDVFSLDAFRRMLTGDVEDQDADAPAVDMLHLAVEYRMSRRLLTVVDATNTRWAYRDPLISRARRFDVPV
ncbi:AAA family ATPase, partial [Micromonospora sp. NPDC049230]|uniref:AAA family ATPase n=1 Tax=Micromonospora sp. NPDC049230 TaxID=3155502 RepID=UPI0033E3A3AE